MAFMYQGLKIAGLVGLVAFLVFHWMSDLSWYGFVSICVDKGFSIMDDKAYKFILGGCGIFLIVLGINFVYNGIISI
jgi:hypothetical protein